MTLQHVLERLASNVFVEPYASDGKINGVWSPLKKVSKSVALTKRCLQINGPRRIKYISFDIDEKFAGVIWDDANLPPPNLIVVNPTNLHAHLIYELESPIWLRKGDDDRNGEALPVRYLKAVRKAMAKALKADQSYNGLTVNNPLHPSWDVCSGRDKPYTLSELSEHLNLDESQNTDVVIQEDTVGRRAILFDSIRMWAYQNKRNYDSREAFHDDILIELEKINDSFEKGREAYHVIKSTAKSVSQWVWNRYDRKRVGIMGLDPSESIRVRQQKGQQYTCGIRNNKTLIKIQKTITFLLNRNVKITKSSVAKDTGFTRKTINNYWVFVSEMISSNKVTDKSLTPGSSHSLVSHGTPPVTDRETAKRVLVAKRLATLIHTQLPTSTTSNRDQESKPESSHKKQGQRPSEASIIALIRAGNDRIINNYDETLEPSFLRMVDRSKMEKRKNDKFTT